MGLSKSNSPTGRVKLLVSPAPARIPWSLLSWLVLGSGAAFLVAVIVSGARLIVDPYSPNWLKTALPGLSTGLEVLPQTPEDIRAELRSQNIPLGQPVAWPNTTQPKAWFYPILNPDSSSIKELWVYRAQGNQLQRMDQVTIRPIQESFITTPLVGTAAQVASVENNVALTSMGLIPGKSKDKPWVLLTGQRRYGNTTVRYGQILSYQPQDHRLHRLLSWTSPAGKLPQWQRGATGKQLVIDQTVGLRPNFLLYQLLPNNPPQLREISLYRSAYDRSAYDSDIETPIETSLYDKALQLAQGAVWSHGMQMMQSAQKALAQNWSPEAQTQLELIQLHAKHTQTQTEQNWSRRQQHILAYLIDGQWDDALGVLEAEPASYDSTLKQLERDFDALWRGVSIHLQVHPNDVAPQIWGALLVTARQSPEAGETWLKQKTRSQKTLERLQALGQMPASTATAVEVPPTDDTEKASAVPKVSTTAAATLPPVNTTGRFVGLIGQAMAMGTPDDGWLRSQNPPTPGPGQTWYHIDVQLLQDSSGWGLAPAITAANFWVESSHLQRHIQLFNDHRPIAGITVHGVKRTDIGFALLAIGPATEASAEAPALAATHSSLQWLTHLPWQTAMVPSAPPNRLDDPTVAPGIPEQTQATPSSADLISVAIAQHLELTPNQTAQLYPHLNHAKLNLMGDAVTEHIFSIGHSLPSELALPPGKTMIFSNTGELLYSDITQEQALLALTSKSEQQPAILLIKRAGRYTLIGL